MSSLTYTIYMHKDVSGRSGMMANMGQEEGRQAYCQVSLQRNPTSLS